MAAAENGPEAVRRRFGAEAEANFTEPHAGWPDDRICNARVMAGAHAMIGTARSIRPKRPADR
jgi:hypothetical protein